MNKTPQKNTWATIETHVYKSIADSVILDVRGDVSVRVLAPVSKTVTSDCHILIRNKINSLIWDMNHFQKYRYKTRK